MIVYINDQGALGGAELSFLHDIAEHWRLGQQVVLICPPNSTLSTRAAAVGVPIVGVPFAPVLGSAGTRGRITAALSLATSIRLIRRCVTETRPAVIVGNSAKSAALAGIAARLSRRRPLVLAINHEDFYYGPFFSRTLYYRVLRSTVTRLADYVVVHTNRRQELLRKFVGERRAALARIPVDLRSYADAVPLDLRAELGLPPSTVLFGMVGQLIAWKGQREFILAAKELLARHSNCHFVLVGDAKISGDKSYPNQLRDLCQEHKLTSHVSFLGWRDDVPRVMAALDVFVLASYDEPFGRVVLEAMAAGRAVIATAAGGPLELIDSGRTGLLVPPRDAPSIAAAMQHLIVHPEERRRLGDAARTWIFESFGVDRPIGLTMAGICARIVAATSGLRKA